MRWVLMPGFDGTGILFKPLLACLPAGVEPQVISYSETRAQSYEELLPSVLRALPKIEPFIIIAESFSGPLVLLIASQHKPSNLKAVILSTTFATCPPAAHLLSPVKSFIFRFKLPEWVARRFLFGNNAPAEFVALFHQSINTVPAALMEGRLRALLALNPSPQLEHFSVPLLYLQGAQDRLVPKTAAQTIQKYVPEMKLRTIDAPHLLLQLNPRQAVAAITQFLLDARI